MKFSASVGGSNGSCLVVRYHERWDSLTGKHYADHWLKPAAPMIGRAAAAALSPDLHRQNTFEPCLSVRPPALCSG
jgi:hypothetical protein